MFVSVALLGCTSLGSTNEAAETTPAAPARAELEVDSTTTSTRPSTTTTVLVEPGAETDVAILADFVEEKTGLVFLDEPVVDFSSISPETLDLDSSFFASEDTWRLLQVTGLVDPDDDREAAAQARIDQIRGACCPVQMFETEDHPLLTSVVLVHELTHLVDQGRMEEMPFRPGDEVVSLTTAVSEGNAQRVALAYRQELEEAGAAPDRFIVDWSHPDIPDAFLQILEFPYDEGYSFSSGLEAAGGLDQVDESFRRPPVSSKQILDVEAYLEAEWPTPVRPPEASTGEPVQQGVVGAFVLKLILERAVSDSAALDLAKQWSGDAYTVSVGDAGQCLAVDMVMDSPAAREALESAVSTIGFETTVLEPDALQLRRCLALDNR